MTYISEDKYIELMVENCIEPQAIAEYIVGAAENKSLLINYIKVALTKTREAGKEEG